MAWGLSSARDFHPNATDPESESGTFGRSPALRGPRRCSGARWFSRFVISRSSVQIRASAPSVKGSIPETWVTDYSGGIGDSAGLSASGSRICRERRFPSRAVLERIHPLMRAWTAAACLAFLASTLPSGAQERVAAIAGLDFHSSFWVNLHHRLHADARDKKARVDASGWPAEEAAAWRAAVEFYARDLAQRDLRTGKEMTLICGRLSGASDSIASLGLADEHRLVLEAVAPVYRKRLWPRDDTANRAWVADVSSRFERV